MPGATLSSKIYNSKILVILRDADRIVVAKGLSEDLGQMLGPEHMKFRRVPDGHGFSVLSGAEVIKHILDFWELDVWQMLISRMVFSNSSPSLRHVGSVKALLSLEVPRKPNYLARSLGSSPRAEPFPSGVCTMTGGDSYGQARA